MPPAAMMGRERRRTPASMATPGTRMPGMSLSTGTAEWAGTAVVAILRAGISRAAAHAVLVPLMGMGPTTVIAPLMIPMPVTPMGVASVAMVFSALVRPPRLVRTVFPVITALGVSRRSRFIGLGVGTRRPGLLFPGIRGPGWASRTAILVSFAMRPWRATRATVSGTEFFPHLLGLSFEFGGLLLGLVMPAGFVELADLLHAGLHHLAHFFHAGMAWTAVPGSGRRASGTVRLGRLVLRLFGGIRLRGFGFLRGFLRSGCLLLGRGRLLFLPQADCGQGKARHCRQ
jgi:hypothetical protein